MVKLLGFDLEIAKDLPEYCVDWHEVSPLGITCAAVSNGGLLENTYYSMDKDLVPEPRAMRSDEAQEIVKDLVAKHEQGFEIVTWNGLAFDWQVLAEESGMYKECGELAFNHIDMMFHVVAVKGFGVKLDSVATTMGIPSKFGGMSGKEAPRLWREGQYDMVLPYVKQDAKMTVDVALACNKLRKMIWTTKRGKKATLRLPQGWLSVKDCLNLPKPDTSWMDDDKIWQRERFVDWMGV